VYAPLYIILWYTCVCVTGPKLLLDILIPTISQTVSSGISDPVDIDLALFSEEDGKIRFD